ncbi:MAG: phytanoyl-CoA dioxygenase family protein [Halobacteriaceae archaeon]
MRGHLDGYANWEENPEPGYFTVAAVVYLGPVEPRGGGFTVWPGSHRTAATFFEDHALETAGGAPNNASIPAREDGEWDFSRVLPEQYDPHECTGDAGTLVLWHNKLTHTAGANRSPNLRMAAIKRYSRPDGDEILRDAADEPFEYWPAME